MQDILDFERKSDRKLIEGEHFTVFVPFAARWPVEVHMLAHRQVPDLASTTRQERDEIAVLYPRILTALDRLYGAPPLPTLPPGTRPPCTRAAPTSG